MTTKKKTSARKRTASPAQKSPGSTARKASSKSSATKRSTSKTAPRSSSPKKKSTAKPQRMVKLGRSRIPVDAPLEVVFEHDNEARTAFQFLGISTIRQLEEFEADELVMRLTSPTKLMVGRIRKTLAINNRSLLGDEKFAVDFQKSNQK